MNAVIVVGVFLPVMWFGLWIPIMVAVARLNGLRIAVAVPLAVFGPVGAIAGLVAARVRNRVTTQDDTELSPEGPPTW